MKLVHDTQQQEYVMIDAPNYVINNKIKRYKQMKAEGELEDITFWQFLVWEDYEDMNPNNINTVKPNEVREV